MRILYIDIDSLRPDHLGCYGYHRNTSPNIDKLAERSVILDNVFCSDAPCLPSRTSLNSGRFGIHTGVIDHGGIAAQPFIEGPTRGFNDQFRRTSWAACMRKAGMHTAMISPFGERHAAWHWYAGFNEIHNTGGGGMESAEEVEPVVLDWLRRRGDEDNWFLHVNVWDPHTPYRAPAEMGNPFEDEPIPAWLTDEVREKHWNSVGPHSAQEISDFKPSKFMEKFPRQPVQASDMHEVRRMFDGYDTGVLYADQLVGKMIAELDKAGVLDETAIIVSADHGENLGELNIYGDHQTADLITTHVPMIIHWPGVTDKQGGRHDTGLHYANDMAATVIELLGQDVPDIWDGVPFTHSLRSGQSAGRDYLVVSQGAWSCQRGVRFNHEGNHYFAVRSYHDGYHGFPDLMLFDVDNDPHEQHNLCLQSMEIGNLAMSLLEEWTGEMMRTATHGQDPMWTVMNAGGAFHTRGRLPQYLERLRETGREGWADRLAAKHPNDL